MGQDGQHRVVVLSKMKLRGRGQYRQGPLAHCWFFGERALPQRSEQLYLFLSVRTIIKFVSLYNRNRTFAPSELS
jgi:hypothetical protein